MSNSADFCFGKMIIKWKRPRGSSRKTRGLRLKKGK